MHVEYTRLEPSQFLIFRDRGVKLTLPVQRLCQRVAGARMQRRDDQRGTAVGFGLGETPFAQRQISQGMMGIGKLGVELRRVQIIGTGGDQIAELDRRMAEYRHDPSKVTTWEAIQQRLLGRTLTGE